MAGPAPTFDKIWSDAAKVVALWEHFDNIHNAAPTNTLDVYDALLTAGVQGTYSPDAVALVRADMSRVAGVLARGALAERWRPFLREMVALIDGDAPSPAQTDAALLAVIRRHMSENALSLLTRTLTLSQPIAVGVPQGNGVIRRLTEDRYGNTIESVNAELLTFRVITDQNNGAREHAEVFQVTGLTPSQIGANNALEWRGSGIDARMTAAHGRSSRIIRNPSFDTNAVANDGDALANVGDVADWEVATPANWRAHSSAGANPDYIYRGFPGAPATRWALECIASDSIEQKVRQTNVGAAFSADVPYFVRVAWRRLAGATGTIQFDLGNSTVSVAIGSGSGAYEHLFIPLDAAAWLDNFGADDIRLKITITGLAVGTVLFDDVVVAPLARIGGTWFVGDGGDDPWMREDKYTADTTEDPTRGEFAYWLWRAFASDGWLPTSGAPTQVYP